MTIETSVKGGAGLRFARLLATGMAHVGCLLGYLAGNVAQAATLATASAPAQAAFPATAAVQDHAPTQANASAPAPPVRARAAETRPLYNIAPGPLQTALDQLSLQTGLQLLYDPLLLEGKVTRGLAGAMSPQKALSALLADSDIAFNFTAADAVALFRKTKTATSANSGTDERPRVITISTNRTIADLYNSSTSVTATKVDESFLNVPLASESLSQGVLRDLQVNRLEDALQYVSGAEVAPNGQSALGFLLRGFPTYQYYLDGVRVSPDLHHDGFRDFANVDRIDVVKGPASLLYGRTEPGGAINVITKQPLNEPYTSLEQQGGSFGYARTAIDSGGPVAGTDRFLYRFNAAYENQHSFRATPGNHRIFLAPVVTFNSSAATATTLYAEYLNSHDIHDSGLPVNGSQLPSGPSDRSLEVGGDIHTSDLRIGLKGSHVFAAGWILRHHLDARWVTSPQSPQAALSDDGLDCTKVNCPVNRELVAIPESHGHTYFGSVDVHRDFTVFGMRHSILAGLDVFASGESTRVQTRSDSSLQINFNHPADTPLDWSLLQAPDTNQTIGTEEQWAGLYLQDQVQITATLYLLAGSRFDFVHERIAYGGVSVIQGFLQSALGSESDRVMALKGRGGLLWHPLHSLSLYGNVSQNFGITAGLFESGSGFAQLATPAEVALEWETGLKFESPHGRASATLAWFNLSKRNVSTPILSPGLDSGAQFLMHAARNQGLEADFRGAITDGLQVLASYAYVDSRIDNDLGFFAGGIPKNSEQFGGTGARLAGVPEHGGSAWATYHLDTGALRGLKLGLGAVVRGNRAGDNANDYVLPPFTKVSALAAYGWRMAGTNFDIQLNVDNLFDRRYFESLSGTRTIMPGAPRRFIATLRASF